MNRSSRSSYQNANSRSGGGFGAGSRAGSGSRSGGGFASGSGSRSGGGRRPSGGRGRQNSTPQGEFAMPVTVTPALPAVESFDELDMPNALLATLTRRGVTSPFPIQAATLPNSLAGRDVLGRGRTGSGKTIAFGLAVLANIAGQRAEPRRPLALVLVPTRELAQQVTEALTPYAHAVRLRMATAVGGMSIGRQAQTLNRGAEVVVATPGRLKDLIQRGDCQLDGVGVAVLDEADQMADMGFLPQVTELLEQVAEGCQTMLFSATLDRNVDRLVRRFLNDPVTHSVDPSAAAVSTMEHHVLHVQNFDKNATIAHIASREGGVIMFTDTKHGADRLVEDLLANGVKAAALHGGKSQPQRTRTLEQFRSGQVTALIATNVAARGIHVDGLDLVVNLDPPADHKDYLHRGGRTARAGESGTVVTLVLPNQRREMTRLMATAGITPTSTRVHPGDEELARITGARVPTGVPVVIPDPVVERPRRRAYAGGGERRGRSGETGRSPQSTTGARRRSPRRIALAA
ncbi:MULTISPECIES: DEAD/DEAH box helicase [unclassified Streptomyces]|uniref:DEAD/DEAH box helicase n=1 Tax=Streptomycetaceae TaxID=2062 RepID=UPI002E767A43|nr:MULTISPECIES: DEAD/DEAH box helicase [unclassified Streptomyces]MED7948992.1 DEAD/DEAH box helicase [Streptomyces sp. BE303]MEE1825297.1 DEAD/DEAH box helicase [Streptomyces sp. BE20]